MLGRRRNTVKIGILAVFGPKPWTPPPRRAENGPPALFDDQPNGPVWDARPEPGFPRFRPLSDVDSITYVRGGWSSSSIVYSILYVQVQ